MTKRHAQKRRGFTLTELAIVLGVIGTILSAIWVASARVSANNKVQKVNAQVQAILAGYRSLYAARGIDVPENTDVTCIGVNAGYFPSDMLGSIPCTNVGNFPNNGYPASPWNNQAQVTAYVNENTIAVTYYGLPQSACVNLLSNLTASPDMTLECHSTLGSPPNCQWLPPVAAGAGNTPWTSAQINGFCGSDPTTAIQVGYSAR